MKAPGHLNKDGRQLWQSLTQDYSIADAGGLALVTVAAECLDRMREAQKIIAKHGLCIETAAGGLKGNAACQVEKDARTGMLSALKALNLDIEPLRDNPGRPTR